MNRNPNAATLRLACAVAAVCITFSIAGFIDFLATSYTVAGETAHRPVITAEHKP